MSQQAATGFVSPSVTALPENIVALTSTRVGGVSRAPFDTMNLGLHVGDEEQAVQENRKRLAERISLPDTPLWLNQTHSSHVENVSTRCVNDINADGSFTNEPGKVLGVLTADCLPIVIAASDGSQLAVVHAGWRGLASGIVGNALTLFSEAMSLQAWLGPAIGASRFEVGEDVREAFCDIYAGNRVHFASTAVAGKYMADLYALARVELRRHGCESVAGGEYCTYTQSDMFHSYRRDGVRSGRMATLAWMRESL